MVIFGTCTSFGERRPRRRMRRSWASSRFTVAGALPPRLLEGYGQSRLANSARIIEWLHHHYVTRKAAAR